MYNLKNLLLEKERIEKELLVLQEYVMNAPDGKLISRNSPNGSFRYSKRESPSSPEIYIPKHDILTAKELARKDYCAARLKDLNLRLRIIDKEIQFLQKESFADQYLRSHPGAADLILPDLKGTNEAARKWASETYIQSTNHPENLKYHTLDRNLYVRSKSEAEMVSRFLEFHVPYRYEELIVINNIALHPDFTCLNARTGKIYYIEHQGKWDDPEYVKKVREREDLYIQAGIYPWKNLLITTETLDQPFDINWFDEIIKFYLI